MVGDLLTRFVVPFQQPWLPYMVTGGAAAAITTMPPIPQDSLQRFITAQAGIYEAALAELRRGRKRTHWMWFVFPQLAGLGTSERAVHFALASRSEAAAYLAHPMLGPRLVTCCEALLALVGQSAESVLGEVDALKLRSSMTVFAAVADGDSVFRRVLSKYYDGHEDPRTLSLLASAPLQPGS